MKRKQFLTSASLLIGGSIFAPRYGHAETLSRKKEIIPPYLQPGDTIGITSPSGNITPESVAPAIEQIKSWGYNIEIGKTIGKKDGTFGGTDEERIADFQYMLDNPHIKAILCARGGYGIVRIIDRIDFSHLRKHPKWIIGFSDITVFHAHIDRNYQVATIHSKMCNSFPDVWETAEPIRKETILSLRQILQGESMSYHADFNSNNHVGISEGILIGGNLRTLENLAATNSELETKNKILFLEEVEEPLYNIDRMFWNLKRSGKLEDLAGLIIGGFKVKPDPPNEEPFGMSLQQIVLEKIKLHNYPVCFDFPVGHQINNYALKCGVKHRLNVSFQGTTLSEIQS